MPDDWFNAIRNSRGGQKTVAVGTSSQLLLGPSMRRVALAIAAGDANAVHVSWGESPATVNHLQLPVDGSPLVLSRWLHGSIVTGPFYAISVGAEESIVIWETLAPYEF